MAARSLLNYHVITPFKLPSLQENSLKKLSKNYHPTHPPKNNQNPTSPSLLNKKGHLLSFPMPRDMARSSQVLRNQPILTNPLGSPPPTIGITEAMRWTAWTRRPLCLRCPLVQGSQFSTFSPGLCFSSSCRNIAKQLRTSLSMQGCKKPRQGSL